MISKVPYATTFPEAVEGDLEFVRRGTGSETQSRFIDMSQEANTPRLLEALVGDKDNIDRRVLQVQFSFINENESLQQSYPHTVKVTIATTFDKRYATKSDIHAAVAAAINAALSKEDESADPTIVRVVGGEL